MTGGDPGLVEGRRCWVPAAFWAGERDGPPTSLCMRARLLVTGVKPSPAGVAAEDGAVATAAILGRVVAMCLARSSPEERGQVKKGVRHRLPTLPAAAKNY